jgi:CheY-like chemotaxis protein
MTFRIAQRKRVLVIDDDSNDVVLLKLAASRASANIEFEIVNDGHAAIEHLQKAWQASNDRNRTLPDLILLDLCLPQKDGLEILRWIRKTPRLSALKVVVWTGSELPAHRQRAQLYGADLFFQKSADPTGLIDLINGIATYPSTVQQSARPERVSNQSSNSHLAQSRLGLF